MSSSIRQQGAAIVDAPAIAPIDMARSAAIAAVPALTPLGVALNVARTAARSAGIVAVPLLAMLATACSDTDSAANDAATAAAEAAADSAGRAVATVYAPDLGIDIGTMAALPSGLNMRDLEVGSGQIAVTGETVRVVYTGWLPNGVEFDSNQFGQPMTFVLGVGDAMPGWEEGIVGMRAGGRRILVIPPALGYGERGLPGVIPPNSTLVYDVRLEEVLTTDSTRADAAIDTTTAAR